MNARSVETPGKDRFLLGAARSVGLRTARNSPKLTHGARRENRPKGAGGRDLIAFEEGYYVWLLGVFSCDAEIDFFENLVESAGRAYELGDARREEVLELVSRFHVAE